MQERGETNMGRGLGSEMVGMGEVWLLIITQARFIAGFIVRFMAKFTATF